ncbi:O-antigen ligase family protein [Faecalibacillus intestinalis]|uniref:O-antigen ligase family protein n=1 Tax=Faecalibacillus intestinalis TaxID=1982626 RepID=UPI0035202F0F
MKALFKENKILKILFILSFFLIGLFYEFMACLFLFFEFVYLGYLFYRRDIVVYDNIHFILMIFIVFMYLFVCLFAIDKGMALIGFFKQLSILMFIIILMQFDKEERNELLLLIPFLGILMIGISMMGYFIPVMKSFFIINGRIGGFFQYPNTFALFLLIGCVVLYMHRDFYTNSNVFLLILLIGIILTGSRAIYILTAIMLIYVMKNNPKYIKKILIFVTTLILIVALINLLKIDIKVLKRLTQFSFSSSTLLGRMLYYKDGIKVLLSRPLGLGYLGYYFLEPSIQTGVYSIRFIHNDLLQIALDIGIIPCIMFIYIIISSLFSQNVKKENKIILGLIIAHSLFDFDLQYIAIFLILILCIDIYDGKKTKFISIDYKIIGNAFIAISTVFSLYLAVSMSFQYFNLTDLSIKLLPFYTEAKVAKLQNIENIKEGTQLAKSIEKSNSNLSIIYDVYALNEMEKHNYDQMINYKEQSLNLQRYNIEAYDSYINMLYICLDYYQNDSTMQNKYIGKIKEVPKTLNKLKKETDNLAFKIHDQPSFELSKQSKEIIDSF